MSLRNLKDHITRIGPSMLISLQGQMSLDPERPNSSWQVLDLHDPNNKWIITT